MKRIALIGIIAVTLLALDVHGSVPERESSEDAARVVRDSSLVVPGVGAEGILLGMKVEEVKELKGEPERVTQKKRWMLFEDVFKLKEVDDVPFDSMLVYGYPDVTVGLKSGKVQFVIGQSSQRVTSSGVSLERGVQYLIFRMGNEGLHILERTEKSLYMYSTRGLALFDDGSDDSIEMYAVFKPSDLVREDD